MELEKTKAFSLDDLAYTEVRNTLREVWDSLREKGYNPTNQIVGYLISGDPGFISSYQDARKKITKLDRSTIVALLLKEYIK
ncbi:MAG: IreB family regulatory phosphoprotein [Candidatus Faecenecus gallistercoris]|nr:IreB family regulatory phosphoprotein [Bacillota bacterium]MDD7103183.1 IreB family regulatory phosphoprotein [Bacillota bacterium]MDY4051362.1 IreB family regulatory phosphoprotein [Candidatus Faecenecus gallistercoris]